MYAYRTIHRQKKHTIRLWSNEKKIIKTAAHDKMKKNDYAIVWTQKHKYINRQNEWLHLLHGKPSQERYWWPINVTSTPSAGLAIRQFVTSPRNLRVFIHAASNHSQTFTLRFYHLSCCRAISVLAKYTRIERLTLMSERIKHKIHSSGQTSKFVDVRKSYSPFLCHLSICVLAAIHDKPSNVIDKYVNTGWAYADERKIKKSFCHQLFFGAAIHVYIVYLLPNRKLPTAFWLLF